MIRGNKQEVREAFRQNGIDKRNLISQVTFLATYNNCKHKPRIKWLVVITGSIKKKIEEIGKEKHCCNDDSYYISPTTLLSLTKVPKNCENHSWIHITGNYPTSDQKGQDELIEKIRTLTQEGKAQEISAGSTYKKSIRRGN